MSTVNADRRVAVYEPPAQEAPQMPLPCDLMHIVYRYLPFSECVLLESLPEHKEYIQAWSWYLPQRDPEKYGIMQRIHARNTAFQGANLTNKCHAAKDIQTLYQSAAENEQYVLLNTIRTESDPRLFFWEGMAAAFEIAYLSGDWAPLQAHLLPRAVGSALDHQPEESLWIRCAKLKNNLPFFINLLKKTPLDDNQNKLRYEIIARLCSWARFAQVSPASREIKSQIACLLRKAVPIELGHIAVQSLENGFQTSFFLDATLYVCNLCNDVALFSQETRNRILELLQDRSFSAARTKDILQKTGIARFSSQSLGRALYNSAKIAAKEEMFAEGWWENVRFILTEKIRGARFREEALEDFQHTALAGALFWAAQEEQTNLLHLLVRGMSPKKLQAVIKCLHDHDPSEAELVRKSLSALSL